MENTDTAGQAIQTINNSIKAINRTSCHINPETIIIDLILAAIKRI